MKRSRNIFRIILIYINLILRRIKISWKYNKHKHLSVFLLCILLSVLVYFSLKTKIQFVDKYNHVLIYKDTINTRENFLKQLKFIESGNKYSIRRHYVVLDSSDKSIDTINVYSQYWGWYQLGQSARNICGYGNLSADKFLSSPLLQDEIMIVWLKYNKKQLSKYIKKWNGKWKGTYYITESGILAMAHLCGIKATMDFLDSTNCYPIPIDGNGKRGTDYLQQFGRYNLNLN
jgi:hypothetical protein